MCVCVCVCVHLKGTKTREGLLFNESPLAEGEKRKWESWEAIWYATLASATLMLAVGLRYVSICHSQHV